jgi:hypothetical protein
MPGQIAHTSSPAGTAETKFDFQPSLRDFIMISSIPALKRRAIFKMSRRDKCVFDYFKIEMRPDNPIRETALTPRVFAFRIEVKL